MVVDFLSTEVLIKSQRSIKSRLSPRAVQKKKVENKGLSLFLVCLRALIAWIGKHWTIEVNDKLNKGIKEKTMANKVGVGGG